MLKRSFSNRFSVQLVIAFVLFTMGITLALGIPVTLLIQRQTDIHIQSLMDQANQTTQVLLQNKQVQLQNLSLLVAERPTLNQLVLDTSNTQNLDAYLFNLVDSTEIDGLSICGPDEMIASVGMEVELDPDLCRIPISDGFINAGGQVWLFSESTLRDSTPETYRVILGQSANAILQEFSPQSGLVYALFHDQRMIANSARGGESSLGGVSFSTLTRGEMLEIDGQEGGRGSYLVEISTLSSEEDLQLVSLLDIGDYLANNRQLQTLILAALVAVSLTGAVIAVFVSQRISKPLNQLAKSAAALRGGDLKTPLFAPSHVWEVNQLTNALEDARVSLKHSLDQLQKEKEWIENVLDSIVEGLLTLDEHGRVTYASKGVERILNTQSVLMIGNPIDEYIQPAMGEDSFSKQLPGPYQSRRIPVRIDGYETLLAISESEFVPPDAGNANRALVVRDVSDEERIHRLMGEFMANITHEFRTPLSALAASVELLVEQLPELTAGEIEQLLHALNVAIVNLQSLVDNLLEAASIEAGRFKVRTQQVGLDDIITEAVRTITPLSTKYGLKIRYQPSLNTISVLADQRRTVQALVNLLSNAVKHSPEGGVIRVSTLIVNDKALVEVQDQGEGVPQEKRDRLFHRFTTTDENQSASASGFGIGLSVVKAIIQAQGGEIGLKDPEQGGACFWFTLPLVKGKKS